MTIVNVDLPFVILPSTRGNQSMLICNRALLSRRFDRKTVHYDKIVGPCARLCCRRGSGSLHHQEVHGYIDR